MKNSVLDILVFLGFAGISLAVKYLEWKKKAPKIDRNGRGPAQPAAPEPEAWEPDYDMLREFAEEQKRAGRPLDPGVAAALEALAPPEPVPETPAGPSEAELAMLEEQRRLAELAARLEKEREDAAAAFAAAPENAVYAVTEDSAAAEYGSLSELLREHSRNAVILAEVLAPPVGLRRGVPR